MDTIGYPLQTHCSSICFHLPIFTHTGGPIIDQNGVLVGVTSFVSTRENKIVSYWLFCLLGK